MSCSAQTLLLSIQHRVNGRRMKAVLNGKVLYGDASKLQALSSGLAGLLGCVGGVHSSDSCDFA